MRLNTFLKLDFLCEVTSDIKFNRLKGADLRGALSLNLKRTVCALRNQECETCPLRNQCIFFKSFKLETQNARGTNLKPFVIKWSNITNQTYTTGDYFSFSLILLNDLVEFFPHFFVAIKNAGETGLGVKVDGVRGKFNISKVESFGNVLYQPSSEGLISPTPKTVSAEENSIHNASVSMVKLSLKTPLRLKDQNQLSDQLSFEIFWRAINRRLNLLAPLPAETALALREKSKNVEIACSELRWTKLLRYSSRQKQKMDLGGLIGKISFTGDLADFLPYLKLVENFHVGKQTSFGLGEYEVEI